MEPTLGDGPVYFLAEAPGADEDENTGRPLTGPSGQLLRECIPKGGAKYCSFDNVINCRPPKNRNPAPAEIECCKPRRMQWIQEVKPKLIVGLGAVPMKAMLGSSDLAGMRGRLFAVKMGDHPCWFMPTYHPSFLLHIAKNRSKPLNSMLGHCFRMDIRRAFDVVDRLELPHIDSEKEIRDGIQCFDGHGKDDFEKATALLEGATRAPLKCVDIETKGLRPYANGAVIISAAFSYDNTNFSVAIDHPKTVFSDTQRRAILSQIHALLTDSTQKIAHNVPFEMEWFIWLYDKSVARHDAWDCTQMQAQFIDERRGRQARGNDDEDKRAAYQKLEFLVKQHFGINYKSTFKLNKKDMSKSDLGEILLYNGCDTKYTLRLWHHQLAILKKLGLQEAYEEARMRQPTVALMQALGVDVDQNEVKSNQKKLGNEIDQLDTEICGLKVVKAFAHDKGEFNPASDKDVLEIFKVYLKRPEVTIKYRGEVRYSVDKNVLAQIDHPLAELVTRRRNRSKLKSTYVDGLELGVGEIIFPDGKIHSNLNTTFAETGRTSSDSLNMQNFPQRKDKWIRKEIIPPKNHVILAFDYGQLEGTTAAMCTRDRVLVDALWNEYDIHMEWAHKTADLIPALVGGREVMEDKETASKFRALIKNKLVFPAIFGAQTSSIADYLTAATGIEAPINKIEDLMDEFWSNFNGIHAWQDKLMESYYAKGWVATPTGRRRHYPLSRNQAINHPIQGVACDIVCSAMVELSRMAKETGQWHLHPHLNIHDDLTFMVPDDDKILEESIETIYQVMLTPPYDFVNVPISVSVSVGHNWFELDEIGKFFSHKHCGFKRES